MGIFFYFHTGIYTTPLCQWEGLSYSQRHSCPALTFCLNRYIRLSQSSFLASHSHELLVLLKRPEIASLRIWPWWHYRDGFNGKIPHLPEQGLQHIWHKYTLAFCIRHINALYLWFWGNVERWDKPFLWRVALLFFYLHGVPCCGSEHREIRGPQCWVYAKTHAHHRGDSYTVCWVGSPDRKQQCGNEP